MMSLLEWAEAYLRHRDLFERKIEKIEPMEDGLRVTQKDGDSYPCYVVDELTEELLGKIGDGKVVVVARNKKAHIKFLITNWKVLAVNPLLKFIFANVAKHEKWVLIPNGHDKIAEASSLKLGLTAMHDAISEG